jgi:hypothetical protein
MTQARSDLKVPPVWHLGLRTCIWPLHQDLWERITAARSITNNPLLAWVVTPAELCAWHRRWKHPVFLRPVKNCPETVLTWAKHRQNYFRRNPELFDFFCLLLSASAELGPSTNGQTQTKGDWKQGGERNIWIDNGESNRRRGKAVYQKRNNSYRSPNITD